MLPITYQPDTAEPKKTASPSWEYSLPIWVAADPFCLRVLVEGCDGVEYAIEGHYFCRTDAMKIKYVAHNDPNEYDTVD